MEQVDLKFGNKIIFMCTKIAVDMYNVFSRYLVIAYISILLIA